MEALLLARRPCRVQVDSLCADITDTLSGQPTDAAKLLADLTVLDRWVGQLETHDVKIMEKLIEEPCDAMEQDDQMRSIVEYQKRIAMVRRNCDTFLAERKREATPSISHAGSSNESQIKTALKLPKLEMQKFSDNLLDWLDFWARFKTIHEDACLSVCDKFNYLQQAMQRGSEARQIVEGFPKTNDNYPKAIAALQEQFGNEDLLLQVYVKELLAMIITNVTQKEKPPLSKMYLSLQSHLRALQTLNLAAADPATWLSPLVEASLPEDVLLNWQRLQVNKSESIQGDQSKTRLDQLMEFIQKEVQCQKRVKLINWNVSKDVSTEKSKRDVSRTTKRKWVDDESVHTAAGLHVGHRPAISCVFCDRPHASQDCYKGRKMSYDEKIDLLKPKHVCYRCLKVGHLSRVCKEDMKCTHCGRRHFAVLCPENTKVRTDKEAKAKLRTEPSLPSSTKQKDREVDKSVSLAETSVIGSKRAEDSPVYLMTLSVILQGPRRNEVVRMLLDCGSQRSYIRSSIAEKVNCEVIGKYVEKVTVFGGREGKPTERKKYLVPIKSIKDTQSRKLSLAGITKIASQVPTIPRSGPWEQELRERKITLSDVSTHSGEIDVLIGADLLPSITTGKSVKLQCGLEAFETVFGWSIMGKSGGKPQKERSEAMLVTTVALLSMTVSKLWDLEVLGIGDPVEQKNKLQRELEIKATFERTVTRQDDGRYIVCLPWKCESVFLPNNRLVSERRLLTTTKKLIDSKQFAKYDAVFKEWEKEKFIEAIDAEKNDLSCHYLPHRAVVKETSLTTPVRPVFDASCKVNRNPSLNDCLEKGPNLIELLPAVMMRFREGTIGVVADIRKAFLMIGVSEKDQDYLRFLWWEDNSCSKYKVYRHKRVVFGVTCSPYLLGAVIEHHLKQIEGKDKDIARKLWKSFYVDNVVTSVNSTQDYMHFQETATELMRKAKMELRQWDYGPREVSRVGPQDGNGCGLETAGALNSCSDVTSVLGMKWDRYTDTLRCIKVPKVPEYLTKRILLSMVQNIFDPLGFLSPALLIPKLILQDVWVQKLSWDEQLPEAVRNRVLTWTKELSCLEQVRIPRNMTGGLVSRENWEMHCFCDASRSGYAGAIFLRVESQNCTSVQLMQAKARVAPLKHISIPRLELLGCTIVARLANSVKQALDISVPTFFWTDSSTALAWISRQTDWGTFVANRVKEIRELTRTESWRLVPGKLNPADLPSRGCSPEALLTSAWWEGPQWLKLSPDEWPQEKAIVNEGHVAEERRKGITKALLHLGEMTEEPWYVTRCSSYVKCIRVLAWVQRFVHKSRKQSSEMGALTVDEILSAERLAFKMVQSEMFSLKSTNICGLSVRHSMDGLIYVDTRLINRNDTALFRMPVLLPNSHPLVDRMIRTEHIGNGHAGVQCTMAKLREKVWIIHTRKAVRRIIQQCIRCKRYKQRAASVPPAPLPENRIKDAKVFEITGVDLCGPMYLKNQKKVWVVLFTCAVYRAVHLELVSTMGTDSFLLALMRFISRRGRPAVIYSDNGTNLVGTANLFRTLDWSRIEREASVKRIQWKFNPPSAAWWGGWWERLIQTVKGLLKRMLGHGKLTYVQLETALCEAEAVVNSRPLTYVREDPDDLIPLTPAMFMTDVNETNCPEGACFNAEHLREKYEALVQLKGELKQRFRKEYLGQLVQRGKTKPSHKFELGDVVLIGSDNKKRIFWPMGRIVSLIPGNDGKVRIAQVKTAVGEVIRPLQRLFPMEVASEREAYPISREVRQKAKARKATKEAEKALTPETTKCTRRGRVVKKPARFED